MTQKGLPKLASELDGNKNQLENLVENLIDVESVVVRHLAKPTA